MALTTISSQIGIPSLLEGAISTLKRTVARQVLPKMIEDLENKVQKAVDVIVEDQGQSVNNTYSHEYAINDTEATVTITISLGPISGPFDTVVQGHSRSTKNNDKAKVSSHTRHYEGERPFQLSNGSWVTSSSIPIELARDAAQKALGE